MGDIQLFQGMVYVVGVAFLGVVGYIVWKSFKNK